MERQRIAAMSDIEISINGLIFDDLIGKMAKKRQETSKRGQEGQGVFLGG
jgi:hypothetical protein